MTEDEKKARKKADRERKRQEARDAAEKKKRFGLTPEKKRKLRVRISSFHLHRMESVFFKISFQLLIMKMATDNLKGEQQRRLEARKNYIEQHLKPLDDLNSMGDGKIDTHFSSIDRILLVFLSSTIESTLSTTS